MSNDELAQSLPWRENEGEANVFVKPDEQNQACFSSAMARKRRRSQRAGGAAVVIEHGGSIISRDAISDLHTTEFRMMLTLMVKGR